MTPKQLPLNAAIEWQNTLNWIRKELADNSGYSTEHDHVNMGMLDR